MLPDIAAQLLALLGRETPRTSGILLAFLLAAQEFLFAPGLALLMGTIEATGTVPGLRLSGQAGDERDERTREQGCPFHA